METLVNLRNLEPVRELHGFIDDKSKIAYVTEQVLNREGKILVFLNHSDEIVDTVFGEMDPSDTGYVFFASELQIDPINNCMVPKHRLATKEEVKDLVNRRIPLSKLPQLRMLDPIRRWHNFPLGSIVAIERHGLTYFRRVN